MTLPRLIREWFECIAAAHQPRPLQPASITFYGRRETAKSDPRAVDAAAGLTGRNIPSDQQSA